MYHINAASIFIFFILYSFILLYYYTVCYFSASPNDSHHFRAADIIRI